MCGEGQEVAIEFCDVHRQVGHALGAVQQHQRAALVGEVGDLPHRVDRAQHVRHVRDDDELRPPADQTIDIALNELPLLVDIDIPQLGAGVLRDELPRDDVAVVLHHRKHDLIAGLEELAPPTMRHEVDRLSGIAREDDVLRSRRADEAGHLLAHAFVGGGRFFGQSMDAAVDGAVVVAVVIDQRVDHRLRLL